MSSRIKSQEDFWAGVMFIGFGILAIIIARDYPLGTTMRMGPGYFPTYVGAILVALGAIISGLALKIPGERVARFAWRPPLLLGISFVVFGWGIDHIGFIPSLLILTSLSAFAGREYRWKEIIIESIVLAIGAWALFIKALELPFPLFWWR